MQDLDMAMGMLLAAALASLGGCNAAASLAVTGHEPVVGGPCEGCEAVFDGIPETVPAAARIAPAGERGEPLRITGRVTRPDGSAAAGIIVYAYHTNAGGVYPPNPASRGRAAYRHGTLRGWAATDADGRYRFDTIRPGAYPDGDESAHVHMHVLEPGRCTYYIDSIRFTDDPRLTEDEVRRHARSRGGDGIVTPRLGRDGVWRVERDIALGTGIADYPPWDG